MAMTPTGRTDPYTPIAAPASQQSIYEAVNAEITPVANRLRGLAGGDASGRHLINQKMDGIRAMVLDMARNQVSPTVIRSAVRESLGQVEAFAASYFSDKQQYQGNRAAALQVHSVFDDRLRAATGVHTPLAPPPRPAAASGANPYLLSDATAAAVARTIPMPTLSRAGAAGSGSPACTADICSRHRYESIQFRGLNDEEQAATARIYQIALDKGFTPQVSMETFMTRLRDDYATIKKSACLSLPADRNFGEYVQSLQEWAEKAKDCSRKYERLLYEGAPTAFSTSSLTSTEVDKYRLL